MTIEDPKDLERVDREIHINELKRQAEAATGGEMTAWQSKDCPPEIAEQFWENVVAYEQAPLTSEFRKLTEAGIDLPPPDKMSDEELTEKLWQVIQTMAGWGSFLHCTNHLSDRELYTRLWADALREMTADMSAIQGGAWHIDLVSSGSEEDIHNWLTYYASEDDRQRWASDFNDPIPDHQDPPFDRDRHLPTA